MPSGAGRRVLSPTGATTDAPRVVKSVDSVKGVKGELLPRSPNVLHEPVNVSVVPPEAVNARLHFSAPRGLPGSGQPPCDEAPPPAASRDFPCAAALRGPPRPRSRSPPATDDHHLWGFCISKDENGGFALAIIRQAGIHQHQPSASASSRQAGRQLAGRQQAGKKSLS